MKTLVTFLFACFLTSSFSQNISPEFSELKGIEDQSGNTHLFYRIYTYFENDPIYEMTNHIYHLDLLNEIDTLFLTTKYHSDPITNFNRWVSDVDYWNTNPAEFIYCGGATSSPYNEGSAYVMRFDGINYNFGLFWGSASYVDISSSNDSLLYLGALTSEGISSFRSEDGGRTWDTLSLQYQFLSLNPYHENIFFVENENRELLRTTDNGTTFIIVDPEFLPDSRFYYDIDGQHIYRLGTKLKVSDNLGAENSWEEKYYSSGKKYLSVDYSSSGTIYLSNKNKIYCSTDYGDNFALYKTLDRNIVGIYKKPGSDKLYAATKYCIYEITSDTTIILKQLPAINDLQWYPLAIGNKWIYNNYREEFNPPDAKEFIGIGTMKVIGDTTLSNQKRYYKLKNEPLYWNIDTGFVRQDSLEGKLYLFLPEENREVLYEDFSVQVEDTIWIDSAEYKTLISEEYFTLWGVGTYKKTYDYSYRFEGYDLVKNIGMYYYDFTDSYALYSRELKGCVINGVVYGDTTVVSVEEEIPVVPTEFSLSQNYPNPFNPITNIQYAISSRQFVTLKVYDVLGNEIATLVNEEKSAGEYEVEFNATELPSGIYFYQLKAGSYIETKKMILLK